MRTDGSFHGSFTLAPLPTAWVMMRRRRDGSILSHAESCMHRRMPHDGACLICVQTSTPRWGQKSIAQRQAKRRPGYNGPCSLRPVREKVLKQSVLCLLLPLQVGCSKFKYKSDTKSARIQLVKLLIFNTLYCQIVL